ncbi:MAG: hypothetical protein WC393_01805 [Candidatus Nanoarchaeia archaeon]|jgi:hypothetical protein
MNKGRYVNNGKVNGGRCEEKTDVSEKKEGFGVEKILQKELVAKNLKQEDVMKFKALVTENLSDAEFSSRLEDFLDYKQSSSLYMDNNTRKLAKDYIISARNNYSKAMTETELKDDTINNRISMFSNILNSCNYSLAQCYCKDSWNGKNHEYFGKNLQTLVNEFFSEIDFSKKEDIDEKLMIHAGVYLSSNILFLLEKFNKKITLDFSRIIPKGLHTSYGYCSDDNYGLPYVGGFMKKGKLVINGDVGNCLGFMMQGGEIKADNANLMAGALMNGGKIRIESSNKLTGFLSNKGDIFINNSYKNKSNNCKAKIH